MDYAHIMRTRGTSYFFASIIFPRKIRSEVIIFYAFVRFFDDIVDHKEIDDKKDIKTLVKFRDEVNQAREGKKWTTQIIYDRIQLARQKNIPKTWIDAFLDAMQSDTQKKRYLTYQELKKYMYGSAEVIGLIMTKIIWYDPIYKQEVIDWAIKLAEAMQYTNFLRDIQEDRITYGRIYIPEEELNRYGLKQDNIPKYAEKGSILPSERKSFMKEQITKTKKKYRQAESTIKYLHKDWQLPVLIALRMYEGILENIEINKYNTFNISNKTSLRKKTKIFCTTLRKKIPLWHRGIRIGIVSLFSLSIFAYIFDIDIAIREQPEITTAIFIIATLPIIFSGKNQFQKLIFIATMRFIEWIGVTTHMPFGEYIYNSPWTNIWILHIPIFIAFSRLLLINIASNITKSRRWTTIMVIALDMVLEPFAKVMNYRTRKGDYIFTAPWINYLSWWIITIITYRIVRKRKISWLRSVLMYLTIWGYAITVLLIK